MAAAIAAFPWTTACSPKTMTLPGADTMNGGAIGDGFDFCPFRVDFAIMEPFSSERNWIDCTAPRPLHGTTGACASFLEIVILDLFSSNKF